MDLKRVLSVIHDVFHRRILWAAIIVLLLWLVPVGIQAQKPDSLKAHHYVGMQLGINQIKDENLHPKTSSGLAGQFYYGFEKEKNNLQHFEFLLGYCRPKTNLEDVSKTVNLRIRSAYSTHFKLVNKEKFIYRLGPEAVLDYNVSYFPNWDDSHLYWADYLSIGASNIITVPLPHHGEWITTVALPVFSVFSRPEPYRLYKIDDTSIGGITSNLNSNIEAAHLTNVFHLQLLTEYRFPAFRNSRESLTYSFEWIRVKSNEGFPFQKLIHQVGIKFFL